MPTHRSTPAPPAGIAAIPTAHQAFLLLRTAFTVAPVLSGLDKFLQGAVRLVAETGKPIAQVAQELGVNEGALGNWWARERRSREGGDPTLRENERVELERLRKENIELRMQREVFKRSVALWVDEAVGR